MDSMAGAPTATQRLLDWLLYGLLLLCAAVTLIPFLYLVCSAVKTRATFFSSLFLPPGHGFLGIDWRGLTLVLASLIIPGSLLLAPSYQLIYRFGLLDSFTGLILPGIAPAFGVFLFRQALLHTVPLELIEAARIDGCGEIRCFFSIILPLVRPMLGAFLLITFLGAWNNFIQPQIILQTPEKFPLSVAIAQLKGLYGVDYGLLMAGKVASLGPVMGLFLLLQKDFIAGLTSGAVKG